MDIAADTSLRTALQSLEGHLSTVERDLTAIAQEVQRLLARQQQLTRERAQFRSSVTAMRRVTGIKKTPSPSTRPRVVQR